MFLQAFEHAEIGHLGRVGYEGKDGVLHVAVDLAEDGADEVLAQLFALAIDVAIAAAGEVDALEGAGA